MNCLIFSIQNVFSLPTTYLYLFFKQIRQFYKLLLRTFQNKANVWKLLNNASRINQRSITFHAINAWTMLTFTLYKVLYCKTTKIEKNITMKLQKYYRSIYFMLRKVLRHADNKTRLIRLVLKRLRKAGIKVNKKETVFCQYRVDFLEHNITEMAWSVPLVNWIKSNTWYSLNTNTRGSHF